MRRARPISATLAASALAAGAVLGSMAAFSPFAATAATPTTATSMATPVADTPAVDANGQLKNQALQARFEQITQQLRCLVCQNESIADSNVELAADLRRQVREMLVAGKSDAAIFNFMTDRYGEFVRFNPPLEAKTLLIWGAPFIMLLLGGIIVYRVVGHRSRMPLDDEPAARP